MNMQTDKRSFMSSPTKLTIIPDTRYSNQEITDKYAEHQSAYMLYKGYLHGELSDIIGYDICMTLEPNEGLEEGIYDATCLGRDCKLFWWHTRFNEYKGLVVLCDDTDSMKYAQECFDNKEAIL